MQFIRLGFASIKTLFMVDYLMPDHNTIEVILIVKLTELLKLFKLLGLGLSLFKFRAQIYVMLLLCL